MIKTIAIYEFLFTIKRKSYYLVTFGMPLIALAYFGLIALIVLASVPSQIAEMGKAVGVIDQSGLLTEEGAPLHGVESGEKIVITSDQPSELDELEDLPIPTEQLEFLSEHPVVRFDDLDSARASLEDESIRHVTVIPADYIQEGKLNVYLDESDLIGATLDNSWLSKLLGKQLLKRAELGEDEIARIQSMSSTTEYELDEEGKFVEVDKLSKGFSLGLPLAVAFLLIIALMMNSSLLLASIAEEKENKVMEVIISSVSADQLLFGKVLGIVLAGLLQIAVWMAMVAVIPALSMMVMKEQFDYDVNVIQLLMGVGFVLLGFVFYGCLLAGIGSLGSSYKDCQQLSVVVILCACVPFMVPTVFLTSPNGMVAKIMSMVPLFSPVAMMARLGITDVPMWEVALSFVIMLISIYVAIKISAKLFRVGTLMQGKRPGVGEIWKVLTQPS